MASGYDLVGGGISAGIGSGVGAAGEKSLDTWKEVRRQDQIFFLTMKQIAVNLKKLDEDARQADMLNKRFYEGLNHQSLQNIRDRQGRRQLERLRSNLRSREGREQFEQARELADIKFQYDKDLADIRGKYQVSAQRAGASGQRDQAYQRGRELDFKRAETVGKAAGEWMNNVLIDEDGKIMSKADVVDLAKSRGYSGALAFYQAQHELFTRSMQDQYGSDVQTPNLNQFINLAGGVINRDSRANHKVQADLRNKAAAAQIESVEGIASHANSAIRHGTDDLPFRWNPVDNQLHFRSSDTGGALTSWVDHVIASGREINQNDAQQRRTWLKNANDKFREITGTNLNELDPGESIALDMMFNDVSTATGGNVLDLDLSRLTSMRKRDVWDSIRRSQEGPAVSLSGGSTPSATSAQMRATGSAVGQVYGDMWSNTADYADAKTSNDTTGMVDAYARARDQMETLKENKGAFISDSQYDTAKATLQQSIDEMASDMASTDMTSLESLRFKFSKGVTGAISELMASGPESLKEDNIRSVVHAAGGGPREQAAAVMMFSAEANPGQKSSGSRSGDTARPHTRTSPDAEGSGRSLQGIQVVAQMNQTNYIHDSETFTDLEEAIIGGKNKMVNSPKEVAFRVGSMVKGSQTSVLDWRGDIKLLLDNVGYTFEQRKAFVSELLNEQIPADDDTHEMVYSFITYDPDSPGTPYPGR